MSHGQGCGEAKGCVMGEENAGGQCPEESGECEKGGQGNNGNNGHKGGHGGGHKGGHKGGQKGGQKGGRGDDDDDDHEESGGCGDKGRGYGRGGKNK